MMNAHSRRGATSRVTLGRRWTLVLSIIFSISVIIFMFTQLKTLASTNNSSTDGCLVSFGTYHGNKYESTATDAFKTTSGEITIGNKCLIQSQWMRVAQHQVQITNNNNNNNNNQGATTKVINDWLWIDYHDRINVLVQDPNSSSTDNPSFLILKQTKYALSSQESLAVVGGIVEPNEEPLVAARREVEEELHVTCKSWTSLGRYRTDVNRGMGWVHPYLARDCSYSKIIGGSDEEESNVNVGIHDMEKQNVQSMTLSEVKASVMDQKFVEVQWSNTVSLAMLNLMM